MPDVRLPLAVDFAINRFVGASITEYDRGLTNAIAEKRDGKLFVTQRPSIDVFDTIEPAPVEPTAWAILEGSAYPGQTFNAVTHADGIWLVAGNDSRLMRSVDGRSWEAMPPPFAPSAATIYDLAYGDGIWIAVGAGGSIATSIDAGRTWAMQDGGFGTSDILSIAYADGLFVAVGLGGKIGTTRDGVTWAQQESGVSSILTGVAFGAGLWTVVGYLGDAHSILTSPDAETWTGRGDVGQTLLCVAFGDDTWVVGGVSTVFSSGDPTDSEEWTEQTSVTGIVNAVAYRRGIWVAIGTKIFTAADVDSWSEQVSPFDDGSDSYGFDVEFADGQWLIPGQQRVAVARSPAPPRSGRAAYYWDAGQALYFLNGGAVYRGGYANPIGDISEGTSRCYFFAVGSVLVLLDPENGEGWVIDAGNNLAAIDDDDFPPEQTPGIALAHGGAVLNGRLYVLGADGTIYGSDLEDPTSWAALNFVTAERDPDGGTYLAKHHDHIVAMGPRTIEVFYDAANPPPGSPLSRRGDVAYNMGCNSGESVWEAGDRIFFVGAGTSGTLGVYAMEQFALKKLSSDALDSFLTTAITREGYIAVGSGFGAQGHTFYLLTLFAENSEAAELSLVYDDTTGLWYRWTTDIAGLAHFPLVSWSIRTSVLSRFGEGIMASGELFTISDNLVPQDSVRGSSYIDGWIEDGYFAESAGLGTAITMSARAGMADMGTDKAKFASELRVIGDRVPAVCAVRYANDASAEDRWGSMRILDLSRNRSLRRLGRFHRRNHELIYAGDEQVRLEALELTLEVGAR